MRDGRPLYYLLDWWKTYIRKYFSIIKPCWIFFLKLLGWLYDNSHSCNLFHENLCKYLFLPKQYTHFTDRRELLKHSFMTLLLYLNIFHESFEMTKSLMSSSYYIKLASHHQLSAIWIKKKTRCWSNKIEKF